MSSPKPSQALEGLQYIDKGQGNRIRLDDDNRLIFNIGLLAMLEEWIEIRDQIERSKSDLAGQDLSYKKLLQAKLDRANLKGADLSFAYLIRADLRQADLSGADLTSAVLSEANLSGANLEGTELEDAYLHGADLSEVKNLTCGQLEFAQFDKDTRLPDYLCITWLSDSTFECKE